MTSSFKFFVLQIFTDGSKVIFNNKYKNMDATIIEQLIIFEFKIHKKLPKYISNVVEMKKIKFNITTEIQTIK